MSLFQSRARTLGLVMLALGIVLGAGDFCEQGMAQQAPAPAPAPAASAPAAAPGKVTPAGVPSAASQPASVAAAEPVIPAGRGGYVYLPEGRRDPFLAVLKEATGGADGKGTTDEINLPPLQRVTVAELAVIGIVWGGFGYMAMVQTPDGKGYAIQRGTRIGNNGGIVSAITDKAVVVEERFTDIYGKKQVREYAKPLHTKESMP